MAMRNTHVFVDGAYLREASHRMGESLADPFRLAKSVIFRAGELIYGNVMETDHDYELSRIVYYDARPDDEERENEILSEYWRAVELLPDTELGFGSLRGRKPVRQKGVDTLLATHLLVGAFTGRFEVAVLVAGDADFVPVVREVRRHGLRVFLAADPASLADDLRREADRFVQIGEGGVGLAPLLSATKEPFCLP